MRINKLFNWVINLFRLFKLGEITQASQIIYYEVHTKWLFVINMKIYKLCPVMCPAIKSEQFK